MELKITKEKVLAAASKCSTAKATLKVLFPEAFQDSEIKMIKGNGSYNDSVLACRVNEENGNPAGWMIAFPDGENNGFSFDLSSDYDWEILDRGTTMKMLKPKKKQ